MSALVSTPKTKPNKTSFGGVLGPFSPGEGSSSETFGGVLGELKRGEGGTPLNKKRSRASTVLTGGSPQLNTVLGGTR